MGIRKEITTLSVNTSSRQTAQNVKIYCDLLCFDLHDINSGIWIRVVSCERGSVYETNKQNSLAIFKRKIEPKNFLGVDFPTY